MSAPPLDEATGEPDTIDIMFQSDDRVVTLSGPVVEYWDARQGRRLSSAVELPSLAQYSRGPVLHHGAHPDRAYVTASVQGEPEVHTIDLRTGRRDGKQRIRLAEDLLTAEYLSMPMQGDLEDSSESGGKLTLFVGGLLTTLFAGDDGRPRRRAHQGPARAPGHRG
ncbi:hypothetical protein [Streptomyces sp. NPDC006195]|uniref:hypothetical protein n=1 Tax=unclassified Streptomyces TaxID=2593676 RepID=UPI0033A92C08